MPELLPVLLKVCAKVGIPKERIFLYGEKEAQGISSVYSLLADKPVSFPLKGIDSKEDVAFVCYSSGTTGLAKGVMLTHRNFISQTLLSNAVGEKDKAEDDIVLGFLPFFHIFGKCCIVASCYSVLSVQWCRLDGAMSQRFLQDATCSCHVQV